MTPRQLEIIQHALGCDQYGRSPKGCTPYYRNQYCAGGDDEAVCRALVELGFMQQHKTTEWLPYFNCSVTPAGIKAMRDESQAPPKLTRSQKRYRDYLNADLDISFREYMKLEAKRA